MDRWIYNASVSRLLLWKESKYSEFSKNEKKNYLVTIVNTTLNSSVQKGSGARSGFQQPGKYTIKIKKFTNTVVRISDTVRSDLPTKLEGKSNLDSVISIILPNLSGTGIGQILGSFVRWEAFVQDGDPQTITIKDHIERARSKSPRAARTMAWNVGLTLLGASGTPVLKVSMLIGVKFSKRISKSVLLGLSRSGQC